MILSNKKMSLKNFNAYVVASSVRGVGKIENQDSVEIRNTNKHLIIVVADGLGSAAYSKEGSAKAVKITADLLEENNYNNLANNILKRWKTEFKGDINQYDTTIKFICVTDEYIAVGGIGDGWIALKNDIEIKSFVFDNEFSNQTDSILSLDLENKFWMKKYNINEFNSMLIATDGFSEDIQKENAFEFLKQIEYEIKNNRDDFVLDLENTLINWPVQTNKDDKTVVFIVLTKEK